MYPFPLRLRSMKYTHLRFRLSSFAHLKKFVLCVFSTTLRNRHPQIAGCDGTDVLVVQPGYQNSIILIADKYQCSLLNGLNELLIMIIFIGVPRKMIMALIVTFIEFVLEFFF